MGTSTRRVLILALLPVVLSIRVAGQAAIPSTEAAWSTLKLPTRLVPGPVEVGVLLPPGYSAIGPRMPLLLFLHGGSGSAQTLLERRDVFSRLWRAGNLPPMVVATPSTGQSFVMDYRDGTQRWESFVVQELIPGLRERFHVASGQGATLLAGWSMGGMGALRIAFKYPEQFAAVAAWAPAVEPAFAFSDIDPTDRAYRSEALYERFFGAPVDQGYWRDNHPPYLLRTRLTQIAAAKLQIYIAVGQEDHLLLYRGAEVMHRTLYDAHLKHEYRLVRDANHLTIAAGDNLADGVTYLGRVLRSRAQ